MKHFKDRVYAVTKKIPRGKVASYADVARALGCNAYRAVGQALTRNHDSLVPCHRVVCSDGSVGGYAFNTAKKISLLRSEGVEIENGRVKNFDQVRFKHWQII